MNDEWQRVATDAYVRALVAKHKADGGRHTYDADCMAAALAAVAPLIADAERERSARQRSGWKQAPMRRPLCKTRSDDTQPRVDLPPPPSARKVTHERDL